jgi:hypothetical protein
LRAGRRVINIAAATGREGHTGEYQDCDACPDQIAPAHEPPFE